MFGGQSSARFKTPAATPGPGSYDPALRTWDDATGAAALTAKGERFAHRGAPGAHARPRTCEARRRRRGRARSTLPCARARRG